MSNDQAIQTIYSAQDKANCFQMYTQKRVTIKEIAKKTDVTESTLKHWIKKHKWREKKDEIQNELIKSATFEFMEHIGRERIKTARNQLEVSRLIQACIKDKVDLREDGSRPFIKPEVLARLAKALKDCADVEARAAGLSDKPEQFTQFGGSGIQGVVVAVGLQGIPVQQAVAPKAIDVESVETKNCPF